MSDQWNGPVSGRMKPENLFGQLPQHITAEWIGEDWIKLTCQVAGCDSPGRQILVGEDGCKAAYDQYVKNHMHAQAPGLSSPTPDRKVAAVLKDLNDGVAPGEALRRTPEAHYATAEARLALAERADAVIRERAELDKLPSHTIQTAFDRHCGLANLHRLMAETGLAFEERPPELTVSAPGGGYVPLAPPEVLERTTGPGYDVPTAVYDAIRGELADKQAELGQQAHCLIAGPVPDGYSGHCSCGHAFRDVQVNNFMGLVRQWNTHRNDEPDSSNADETVTVKARLCNHFAGGHYCQRANGHEGPHHFKVASD